MLEDRDWEIRHGDTLNLLRGMPDRCVQCVVTSPPYLGLRDYGLPPHTWSEVTYTPMPGLQPITIPAMTCCLGLEPSPEAYTAHLVLVFRELWRVLRDDGTIWLNIGDSYAGGGNNRGNNSPLSAKQSSNHGAVGQCADHAKNISLPAGLKPKDLMMMPARVSFALQADGYYLRSDIVWCKKAPMPSSVQDRPTTATEEIYLLTKSGEHTYWVHRKGVGSRAEPAPDYRWVNRQTGEETEIEQTDKTNWCRINLWQGHDYYYDREAVKVQRTTLEGRPDGVVRDREWGYDSKQAELQGRKQDEVGNSTYTGFNERWKRSHSFARKVDEQPGPGQPNQHREDRENIVYDNGRNLWNYWLLGPEPLKEKHYAAFPSRIPEIAILAGSSPRACPICGASWERRTERKGGKANAHFPQEKAGVTQTGGKLSSTLNGVPGLVVTTGWAPTCSHDNYGSGKSIVLDPFSGSGTTVMVALRHGRKGLGLELNPDYVKMSKRRIINDNPMFNGAVGE